MVGEARYKATPIQCAHLCSCAASEGLPAEWSTFPSIILSIDIGYTTAHTLFHIDVKVRLSIYTTSTDSAQER